MNYKTNMVFRSTSPHLLEDGKPGAVYECPIGKILREMPYAFDVLNIQAISENAGFQFLNQSIYMQAAFRVVSSERSRIRDLESQKRKTKNDAAYGARVLLNNG